MATHLKSQASCRTWPTQHGSTAAMYAAFSSFQVAIFADKGLEARAGQVVFRRFTGIFVSCVASKAERFSPANGSQDWVSYVRTVIS